MEKRIGQAPESEIGVQVRTTCVMIADKDSEAEVQQSKSQLHYSPKAAFIRQPT
jgi:hypothetical protein